MPDNQPVFLDDAFPKVIQLQPSPEAPKQPQQQDFQPQGPGLFEDIPEQQPPNINESLKKYLYPLLNVAIGGKLTPGGTAIPGLGKVSLPGAVMGYANSQSPANLTNEGLVTQALLDKFVPKGSQMMKQAVSAAVPAATNAAQNYGTEGFKDSVISGLAGVGAGAAMGKGSDWLSKIKNDSGFRGASKEVNQATKATKDSMAPSSGNRDMARELKAFDTTGFAKTGTPLAIHPEVLNDIKKLRAKTPVQKQKAISDNPIRELAGAELDSYLTGSSVKKDFNKSIPLAKLKSYREAAPHSNEIERAYVSRVFKSVKLSEIMKGTADPATLKATLKSVKLDPEAAKVIFSDPERAKNFQRALDLLPDALHKAAATIKPSDLGSTIGTSGIRVGLLGALADVNSWVNFFGKDKYLDKQKAVVSTLDLINNPSKIRSLEVELNRKHLLPDLVRSLALTLKDNAQAQKIDVVNEEPQTATPSVTIPDNTIKKDKQ